MKSIDAILSRAAFALAAVPVLAGPWLFGAWEMWWFWPLAVCLFLSTALFAVRLILKAPDHAFEADEPNGPDDSQAVRTGLRTLALLGCLPFLLYAAARLATADVYSDAERSVLLFWLPFLLGVQIVYGFSRRQAQALHTLLLADVFLLGGYGLVNHVVTGSRKVLWADGYAQYVGEHRATGSYFCPDHFAGVMELAICLGIGMLAARESRWHRRIWGTGLILTGLVGVTWSKSRGGGMTVAVIALAALIWGFNQWPRMSRWCWRFSALSVMGILTVVFLSLAGGYTSRFAHHFAVPHAREAPLAEKGRALIEKMRGTSRGRMYGAALRAWRECPVLGIGPGMHQNVWPRVAATADGDPEQGKWPSQLNNTFFSYEVHNDWLQLLEEYGLAGMTLFLAAAGCVFGCLLYGLRYEAQRWQRRERRRSRRTRCALILGAVLSMVAMAFHSLGDFNLQMPATTWLLGAIVAVPLKFITEPSGRRGRRGG